MAANRSIFPFGSPINNSKRSILAPGELATPNGKGDDSTTGKAKYGGPLMFGGRSYNHVSTPFHDQNPASEQKTGRVSKRSRLFQASPYHSAATSRIKSRNAAVAAGAASATAAASNASALNAGNDQTSPRMSEGMSTTARLILNTLERMSTPLKDAQKMVVNDFSRAEKRKAISERFFTPTSKKERRRPDLRGRNGEERSPLKGPPLRTSIFSSPLPNSRVAPPVNTSVITINAKPKPKPITTTPSPQIKPPSVPISFTTSSEVHFSSGGGKIKSSKKDPLYSSVAPFNSFKPSSAPVPTRISEPTPVSAPVPFTAFKNQVMESKTKVFKFTAPSKVSVASDLSPLASKNPVREFTFSKPEKVMASTTILPASPTKEKNLPDFLKHEFLGEEPAAPVIKKTVSKAGKYKLPDVTSIGGESGFSGIKTASELKQGSVMSILGGFPSSRMN